MGKLVVLACLAACHFTPGAVADGGAGGGDTRGAADAAVDTADAAVPLGPWGPVVHVPLSVGGVDDPTLTEDLLELDFNANADVYVATRASTSDPFGAAQLVAVASSSSSETTPEISYDGLTLTFSSARPGGAGSDDIWITTRPSRGAAWGSPTLFSAINSPYSEAGAVITPDGLFVVFSSYKKANLSPDLYYSSRASTADPWDPPTEIVAVNTNGHEGSAFITADKLTLYFDTDRDGTLDIYTSTRASTADPFPAPQPITEIDTNGDEEDPWVSEDGHHLFFYCDRGGTTGICESSR